MLGCALPMGTVLAQAASVDGPAQPEEQDSVPEVLAEVVVTVQFREQRVQDTPVAVTAVNSEMMEARSQSDLTDIAAGAPNVTIRESVTAYGNTAALSIRGVGQFDNSFAYEPGVGLYIDDVYYPTVYGAQLDLLDLDRVEILRGPQGTLAGKNSIGGAVKLYSQKPTGSGQGSFETTVGNFDRLDVRASADVPVVDDVLALRLAGVLKTRDGHVDLIDYGCRNPSSGVPRQPQSDRDCRLGTVGGQDFKGMRASLLFTPSDRLEVGLIADWTEDDSEPAPTRIFAANNAAPAAAAAGVDVEQFLNGGRYENYSSFSDPDRGVSVGPVNHLEGWGVSGHIQYRLTRDLSLTSITAYRTYDAHYAVDLDGTPYALVTQFLSLGFDSFSQEIRLSGATPSGQLNYTIGGYYFDAKGTYDALLDFFFPPNNYYLQRDRIPSDSVSGFAHVEYRPIDNLTLSGGVRYTDESKDYTFGRISLLTDPFPLGAVNGQTFSYSGSKWDYRISADYRWSNAVMTYVSFATGFKGGGVNPRPYFVEQVVPFEPETLKAYEVGTKLDLFGRRMRLNLAAFINRYDDIQLILNQRFRNTFPASVPINAGKAEMRGYEVELSATPVDAMLLDASISHLDFEYDSLTNDAVLSGINYGMLAPFTSEWKFSAGAQYEFGTAIGTITPRIDWAYQSEFWSNAANRPTNRTPGYGIANARVTWEREPDAPLQLALSVTNLFDKYYDVVNYDNLYTLAGVAQGTVGRPREWALTVKYRF